MPTEPCAISYTPANYGPLSGRLGQSAQCHSFAPARRSSYSSSAERPIWTTTSRHLLPQVWPSHALDRRVTATFLRPTLGQWVGVHVTDHHDSQCPLFCSLGQNALPGATA